MTVRTALLQGVSLLEDAGIAVARLTAEVLLSHAMGRERVYLYAHPEQELKDLEWLHYGRYLHERLQGKPTQYITRKQEFYGREFRVSPDVLIPRPETEHVVETAVRICAAGGCGGQVAILRGGCQPPRAPIDNRRAAWQAAPQTLRILDVGTGSGALAATL